MEIKKRYLKIINNYIDNCKIMIVDKFNFTENAEKEYWNVEMRYGWLRLGICLVIDDNLEEYLLYYGVISGQEIFQIRGQEYIKEVEKQIIDKLKEEKKIVKERYHLEINGG